MGAGPAVFQEYWRRPEATAAAFAGDWFRTGDVARRAGDIYRLLGRASVDIIKTGGYKGRRSRSKRRCGRTRRSRIARSWALPTRRGRAGGSGGGAGRGANSPRSTSCALLEGTLAPYKAPRGVLLVAALPRTLRESREAAVKQLFTA